MAVGGAAAPFAPRATDKVPRPRAGQKLNVCTKLTFNAVLVIRELPRLYCRKLRLFYGLNEKDVFVEIELFLHHFCICRASPD